MKITEDVIDYNVSRLISEILETVYDFLEDSDDRIRCMMLGEIHGVAELGKALKEVLEA